MTYDKPKVTIDLDEYNELLEKVKIKEEDEAYLAKEVIASFISVLVNGGGFATESLFNHLLRKNISFTYNRDQLANEVLAKNINIKKIEPNQK